MWMDDVTWDASLLEDDGCVAPSSCFLELCNWRCFIMYSYVLMPLYTTDSERERKSMHLINMNFRPFLFIACSLIHLKNIHFILKKKILVTDDLFVNYKLLLYKLPQLLMRSPTHSIQWLWLQKQMTRTEPIFLKKPWDVCTHTDIYGRSVGGTALAMMRVRWWQWSQPTPGDWQNWSVLVPQAGMPTTSCFH